MDIRKPKPQPPLAPLTQPEPEPEPPLPAPSPPPKKLVRHPARDAAVPKTAHPPPREPPKAPPRPVFGLDPSQAGGEGISVSAGNTTLADPGQRPAGSEVPPLSQSSGGTEGKEFRPVAEQELRKLPAHSGDECEARMKEKWGASQSHANGLEGEVVLRVELDSHGKVLKLTKLKGVSEEIDAITMRLLRSDPRRRFSPAIGRDGKPAEFVIERYAVRFENE